MMSINRISLYHLETLLWIARLGTFAAAAEQLNTTQPAISARMNELEERLGATLFQKNGRAMSLTPAGRELVRDYLPIWEQLQGALLRCAGFDGIRGIVRIGAGEIAAATCLPAFVVDLKNDWPDLTFEIEIELTAQLIQSLLRGTIDLAFAAGPVAHPALRSMPIGGVELLWVASPAIAASITGTDPEKTPSLWSLSSHSPLYQLAKDAISRIGFPQRSINLCNNVRTMIDIVTQGDGFALLPRSMVLRELEAGLLVQVLAERSPPPIMFHVVTRTTEGDPFIQEIVRRASEIRLDKIPEMALT